MGYSLFMAAVVLHQQMVGVSPDLEVSEDPVIDATASELTLLHGGADIRHLQQQNNFNPLLTHASALQKLAAHGNWERLTPEDVQELGNLGLIPTEERGQDLHEIAMELASARLNLLECPDRCEIPGEIVIRALGIKDYWRLMIHLAIRRSSLD